MTDALTLRSIGDESYRLISEGAEVGTLKRESSLWRWSLDPIAGRDFPPFGTALDQQSALADIQSARQNAH